jgi:hypothetical protein
LKVKKLDTIGNYFELQDPDATVSLNLGGYVTLLVQGENMLFQIFKNPGLATYKMLQAVFLKREDVEEAAELYAEGITNKDKFIETVKNLDFCNKHGLTAKDRSFLTAFIQKSQYPPPTVRQQLHMNGYGKIANLINFADTLPEFELTCDIFWKFLQTIRTNPTL